MEKEKVKGVLEWPTPKCIKDVQKFLGLANYYRWFTIKHEVELFVIENFVLVFNTRELNRVPTTIFYTTSIGLYSDTSILK